MGLFTKGIKTFEDLFIHGLKDIYYAEQRIVETLPKLVDKASNRQLKLDVQQHLRETEKQVERLDEAFALLGHEPEGTKCKGIEGLLSEGDELMGNITDVQVLDAAIITVAQAVEHYEITRYGGLIAWAQEMDRGDIARLLNQTLKEEKATDKKLTSLAERKVNPRADGKPLTRRSPAPHSSAKSPARKRSAARRRSA